MARLPRLGGPLADRNQGLNWREKFETCPGWGANSFKHLQPPIPRKLLAIYATVGTFVGMLFHNAA